MAHTVDELGTQVESLANQVNQIIKRLNLRIDDLSLTVETLPDVEELRRMWNRIIELETQAKFSEDAVKELEEAREDYVNSFNDVFDKITNAPGMYNTVVENPGGGNTYYSHNKPTLDESDIIWMFTAGGIAVANGRDEEGKPDYKYGFTVDGDFIANAIKAKKIGGEHGYIDFGEGEINFNAGDGDFIHYYKDENGKGVLDINAGTFQNGVATFVNTNYIAPVSEVANGAASAASAAQTTANGAMQKKDYITSGKTTIDGGKITTNSISADKIKVEEVFAKDLTATGNVNFDNGYYSIKNDGNNVTIRTNKPASRLTVMGYAETWINGSDVIITSDIGRVSLSAPYGVEIARSDLTVGGSLTVSGNETVNGSLTVYGRIIGYAKIPEPTTADDGKSPRVNNGVIEWQKIGTPTDAQAQAAVNQWLSAHPEATTTVQNGSITTAKLDSGLKSLLEGFYVENGYLCQRIGG